MKISEKERKAQLAAVLQLAQSCEYEVGHSHQVTRLALQLFDELQALHGLGAQERAWLHYAGLLHDIGWVKGRQGHHKTSLHIILDTPLLPFDRRERLIIGSIARYHRRALPRQKHAHFAELDSADQRAVRILAALLRVADGLDRSHQDIVQSLACKVSPERITLRCAVRGPADAERQEALDKGDLLQEVFYRKLAIKLVTARE